jgi:hypothetical protein
MNMRLDASGAARAARCGLLAGVALLVCDPARAQAEPTPRRHGADCSQGFCLARDPRPLSNLAGFTLAIAAVAVVARRRDVASS